MLQRLYGRKSEQFNPNQMMFDSIIIESLNQNQDAQGSTLETEAPVEPEVVKMRKPSRHHGRACITYNV